MSNSQSGRLYRSAGAAEEPGTILALPNRRTSTEKHPDLVDVIAKDPAAHSGFSVLQIFGIVLVAVLVGAALDSFIFGNVSWITRALFIAALFYSTFKAAPADSWAGWASAPIAFSGGLLLSVNLTGKDFGGWLVTQPLGLLVGLSEHMWVLLISSAIAWVIGRRHQVAYMRQKRQAAKAAS
jgi:hypothetical protein